MSKKTSKKKTSEKMTQPAKQERTVKATYPLIQLSAGIVLSRTHPLDENKNPMATCTVGELNDFVQAFLQYTTPWTWALTDVEIEQHLVTWSPGRVPAHLAANWTTIVNTSIPIGDRWAVQGSVPYVHPALKGSPPAPLCAQIGTGLYALALVWPHRPQ